MLLVQQQHCLTARELECDALTTTQAPPQAQLHTASRTYVTRAAVAVSCHATGEATKVGECGAEDDPGKDASATCDAGPGTVLCKMETPTDTRALLVHVTLSGAPVAVLSFANGLLLLGQSSSFHTPTLATEGSLAGLAGLDPAHRGVLEPLLTAERAADAALRVECSGNGVPAASTTGNALQAQGSASLLAALVAGEHEEQGEEEGGGLWRAGMAAAQALLHFLRPADTR